MRKTYSVAMAVVLILGLTACTEEDAGQDPTNGDVTEAEQADSEGAEDLAQLEDPADASLEADPADASPEADVADTSAPDLIPPVETVFSPYTSDGKVVEYVDLQRYLGKWHEIATFEILFQTDCTGSTATYALNDDGTISVTNECFLQSLDGQYKVDTAVAEVVDPVSNAMLLVQFPGAPKAPYWIIELDGQDSEGDYEWAVVGSSFPFFLWILSRTPQMPPERLEAIKARLIERGYDLSKLSYTVQPM